MPPRRTTVQRRLTELIFGTGFCMVALTLLCLAIYEVHSYRQTTVRSLSTIAGIVAENSAAALLFDDEKLAQEILNGLHIEPEVTQAALFSNQGKLYATYPSNLAKSEFPTSAESPAIHLGVRDLTLWQAVMQGKSRAGTIYFKGDLHGTYQRLGVFGLVLIGIGIISVVIATVLYRYLRRRISEPLAELSASARKITLAKDYSIRAHKSGDDEFGDLTDALNTMLDQIHANNLVLQEQEERFRTLADNMVQLAWMADSAGNFLWYNKRWHDYTGLDLTASLERGWETVHPDHRARLDADLKESFATGHPWKDTFPLRGADGSYRWFLSNATPIRGRDGKTTRWFGTNTDVTELRDIQYELGKARDEALAASTAKDDFLARLSHELRTPLSPVLLIVSDANENDPLPAQVRNDYKTIKKNVELEARLIDDLLDLTAIVRGKFVLHREVAALNDIVHDAVAKVKADAIHKGVTIRVEIDARNPWIECDAVRVQQAIWNVLKNAVKFCRDDGIVFVGSLGSISHDRVSVTITDEGIGMTSQELARVFEAFAQGDHAAGGGSHRFGGLGLGLTIARRVIDLHGGKITASSPGPNQGSTFVIELPVGKGATEHQHTTDRGPVRQKLNFTKGPVIFVLLVEDHEPTRLILERLLTRRQFVVTSVGSIAAARGAFPSKPFELLISDIGLPDGSGYELMREFGQNSKIVGIALTGYGMEADVSSAREAGFMVHLTKPIDTSLLDGALEEALKTLRPSSAL